MTGRGSIRSFVCVALLLLLAAGCSQAPPPGSALRAVEEELRPFLPSPADLLGASSGGVADQLHARLLAGEDPAALQLEIGRSLAPGDAADLLGAEARLVAGDGAGAFQELQRLPEAVRRRPELRLLEARAREMAGDLVESYSLYRALSGSYPVASERAGHLERPALDECRERIRVAVARGRVDDARRDLARLEAWRPGDVQTLRARLEVAAAAGDAAGELAALRSLDAGRALDADGILRLSELELDVGDAGRGLSRLQALAAERPDDSAVLEALDRARFRWRLAHAPRPVQDAAGQAQLTRADLARLIYWLVPGVRADRGGVARIASDIVGHPAQDEVVRVVNLGVMRVDETLHLFQPDRPVRRTEALAAILRSTSVGGPVPACVGAAAGPSPGRESVCQAAATCGLIPSAADCLPGGGVGGREVLDWIRRSLRLSGSDSGGRAP